MRPRVKERFGGIYYFFYRLTPQGYKERISKLLVYGDIKIRVERWIGFSFTYGLALSIVTAPLLFFLTRNLIISLVFIPIAFLGFQLFTYYLLVFSADRRARYIEDMLPDVLQTTSANLRAGMPLAIAFWQSAPKEVGPMAEEIHRVSSEIFAGKSFVEAISEMSERVNSAILRRVASLIAEGVRGGGNIADLLDSIAENLRNMKNIRDESSAKVKGYYASILFGIAIGTPLLLALSLNLIGSIYLMSTQFRGYQIPTTAITKVPLASLIIGFIEGGGRIDVSVLEIYAYLVIVSSSIFGGILVSVVIHGKEIKFVKYSIPLLILSLVLFFIFKALVSSVVGFFI